MISCCGNNTIGIQAPDQGLRPKMLLFDLDGTLLTSDKRITARTLDALRKCRQKGLLIGVSTSRSEQNSMTFLKDIDPDILISSGGALIKKGSEYIFKALFSGEETQTIIETARQICGANSKITVDTLFEHYWNCKVDPLALDQNWCNSIFTDFSDFYQESLKICIEIFDESTARKLSHALPECDCIRFSDGYWYKLTRKNVTKEHAIKEICSACDITTDEIMSFGDDYADIGMLRLCGVGVAMGNAIDEVKAVADIVIACNDDDGIAEYLESAILTGTHYD